jgi:hypothetical protein
MKALVKKWILQVVVKTTSGTHQMEDIMANIIIAGVLLIASCVFIFVYNRK